MLLGIGYLPRRSGPALWRQFDAAEIQEDMAHIAELGFQAVRVPLFWADFQPGMERIAPRVLDRFGQFLQIAADCGLRVKAGLWAGMWDGAFWWPDWGMNPAPIPPRWPLLVNDQFVRWGRMRHPFTDERMLAARDILIKELVGYFATHPALLGWEPLPGFGRLAASSQWSAVVDWLGSTTESLKEAAHNCSCTYLLALDALETNTAVWPDDVIEVGGEPNLSLATFASDRRRLPLNPRWIAFALDLTSTLAQQPVSLALAGLPTVAAGDPSVARDGVFYANEEEAAAHLADVIAIANDRGCPSLWLWRWADIPEERWGTPPYNRPNWRRHTGILRADGSEKKLVMALTEAAQLDAIPRLEYDPDEYRSDPQTHFSRLWYEFQQASGYQ